MYLRCLGKVKEQKKADGKQQANTFWCEKVIHDDDTITVQNENNGMWISNRSTINQSKWILALSDK